MGNTENKPEKLDFLQQYQQPQRPIREAKNNQHPQQPQQIQQDWRFNFQHPHLLKTLNSQWEGNNLRYFFEFCQISLQQLLAERFGTKKYFPEEDLQALGFGIISALSFLQEKGISHGNICSSEVYFDQASSSFKIMDSNLINGRASCLQQYVTQNKFYPLSPEIYQMIASQPNADVVLNYIPSIPDEYLYKNDIWGLGMTLLEAGTLKEVKDIYQGSIINQKIIYLKFQELGQVYSQSFCNLLAKMLVFQFEERPDAVSLFRQLTQQQEFENTFQQQQQQQSMNKQYQQQAQYMQQPQYQNQLNQQQPQQQQQPYQKKQLYQQNTMPLPDLSQNPQIQEQRDTLPPSRQQNEYTMQQFRNTQVQRYSPLKQQVGEYQADYQPIPLPNQQYIKQSFSQDQREFTQQPQQPKQPQQSKQPQQPQQGQIPIRQIIKKIVYPDGRVEQQVQQINPDGTPNQIPSISPSRIAQNYQPQPQQQPQSQQRQQDENMQQTMQQTIPQKQSRQQQQQYQYQQQMMKQQNIQRYPYQNEDIQVRQDSQQFYPQQKQFVPQNVPYQDQQNIQQNQMPFQDSEYQQYQQEIQNQSIIKSLLIFQKMYSSLTIRTTMCRILIRNNSTTYNNKFLGIFRISNTKFKEVQNNRSITAKRKCTRQIRFEKQNQQNEPLSENSPQFQFSQNQNSIQKLRQEIEQSKMLIQQYQVQNQQQTHIPQQQAAINSNSESIEERIKKVIAQSQALRSNFS